MCCIYSISRYNDFVLDLQDSSEIYTYQPVMNKVVSCKDEWIDVNQYKIDQK